MLNGRPPSTETCSARSRPSASPPTDPPSTWSCGSARVLIALSAATEVPAQGLPRPTPGHPFELVVWCDSAEGAVAELRAAGVPVLVEPYRHVSGTCRGYVTDPDGNWLALVSKLST